MKATLKEVLAYAKKNNCAIGAFNTPTFESLMAVIHGAEKFNVPVIISHAEIHENIAPLDDIGPVMVFEAERAKVPVCVHLDHGEHLDYIKHAIDLGFTSVMYDGSVLPYKENVKNTIDMVKYAHDRNVDVEAEIGAMPTREGSDSPNGGAIYTDPDLALKFVKETGIDALAASFGTAHGIYKVKPVLDFERIKKIEGLTHLPLVMHGGSGLSEEDFKKAIKNGIRKINYYTYMAKDGTEASKSFLNNNDVIFYHDIADIAQKAMQKNVEKTIKTFLNK